MISIENFLVNGLKNNDLFFSEIELNFSKNTRYYLANYTHFFDRHLPYLTSQSRQQNINLLKKINKLFDTKIKLIQSFYKNDILIVEEYMTYARKMMSTGEMFFFYKDYENISWTKKEFPTNMLNYLSYQVRLNPKHLTENYLKFMQSHFIFSVLVMDNKEKVIKINQYFSKVKDPFSSNITSRYDDVSPEIRMLFPIVLSSENLFLEIVRVIKDKYLG